MFEESSHPVSPTAMERSYAGTGPHWPDTNDSRRDQPRPGWYISRANGLFVPLIALDELPESIQLRDVPRFMVHWQIAGMEYLGEFAAADQKYEVIHGDASSLQDQWQSRYKAGAAPSELATNRPASVMSGVGSQYESAMSTHSARASRTDPAGLQHANRNDDDVQVRVLHCVLSKVPPTDMQFQSRIDDIIQSNTQRPSTADHMTTSLTPRPLPPSGREPDLGRKVYCTYWVSSGECNYTQQGCLYKHEMPDRATLAKIGFRTIPRWWQERHSQGMKPLQKAGHGQEGLAKHKQKHHHHQQQQQHGRSGSEESHSSGGTDSTGSLRLGNPDSQRFRRSKLNAAVDAMGKSVRGRGSFNMASKRGSGSHAQQRGRLPRPETRARGRWPMDFNNGVSSQLHSRRESTASVREMRVLNATDPPLQPLQQSPAAHRPMPTHLLRLQASPRPSITSPTLLSRRPNEASVDSDIAITAPPSTPATLQDAQEDENEKGKDKDKGIYDPKTQQVVSPSVIHKPLFMNTNANVESNEEECQITNLNRRMADAAVSRAGSMRVEQMSSGSTGAPAPTTTTAAAASRPTTLTTSTTPSTSAPVSTGKPHKKAKQPTKAAPQIKAKKHVKAKDKAKAKAIIPNAKTHGLARNSSSAGDGHHDDLLLVEEIPKGEGDPAGGHSGAGGASSGRDSSHGAGASGVGSGSGYGSGSGSKPEQNQNGKGQSHRKAKANDGDSNSNSNTTTKRKGQGNFRRPLVSE